MLREGIDDGMGLSWKRIHVFVNIHFRHQTRLWRFLFVGCRLSRSFKRKFVVCFVCLIMVWLDSTVFMLPYVQNE